MVFIWYADRLVYELLILKPQEKEWVPEFENKLSEMIQKHLNLLNCDTHEEIILCALIFFSGITFIWFQIELLRRIIQYNCKLGDDISAHYTHITFI